MVGCRGKAAVLVHGEGLILGPGDICVLLGGF